MHGAERHEMTVPFGELFACVWNFLEGRGKTVKDYPYKDERRNRTPVSLKECIVEKTKVQR